MPWILEHNAKAETFRDPPFRHYFVTLSPSLYPAHIFVNQNAVVHGVSKC